MKRYAGLWVVALMAVVFVGGCATTKVGSCDKPCGFKAGDSSSYTYYGEKMKLAADKTACIKDVFANPKEYNGKFVRICGQVESVCAAKGCWMKLAYPGAKDTLFIKFSCPVDGRLIPMEAVGHQAIVEGTFTVGEISEGDARHYAEDAGKSLAEIAKIVGPQKQLRMSAPAAMVRGV